MQRRPTAGPSVTRPRLAWRVHSCVSSALGRRALRLEFEQVHSQGGSRSALRIALPPALTARRLEVRCRDCAGGSLLAAANLQQLGGTVVIMLGEASFPELGAGGGAAAARSLAAAGDCSLTVAGVAHAFDSCQSIPYFDDFSGLGGQYDLFYSLDTSGAAPALKVGMRDKPYLYGQNTPADGGWVSFALSEYGLMGSSPAAIAQAEPGLPSAAAVSVAGYMLPSSQQSGPRSVTSKKGTVALTATAASVAADGAIRAGRLGVIRRPR